MSRIGKKPIPIPSGVEVVISENLVRVKGPKGELQREIPEKIKVELVDGNIIVERESDAKTVRALHGTTRALLANMVRGVSEGFEKILEIHGTGYNARLQGQKLELNVGYSHPVIMEPPPGITFEVQGNQRVVVKGIDKQLVGQVAANIRRVRPPEPYKGKGIRYLGEWIRRKVGKRGM